MPILDSTSHPFEINVPVVIIGAGACGATAALSAREAGAEVIVLDNFRSGHRRNLAGLQHTLIEGSILDRAKLDEAMRGVDQVYH